MSKHPWHEIEREYIEAPSEVERPTLDDLARKYGIHPSYMRDVSSKNKWKERADRYTADVRQIQREKRIAELSDKYTKIDAASVDLAHSFLLKIQEFMTSSTIRPHEVAHLASAAKIASEMADGTKADFRKALETLNKIGLMGEDGSKSVLAIVEQSEERAKQAIVDAIARNLPSTSTAKPD